VTTAKTDFQCVCGRVCGSRLTSGGRFEEWSFWSWIRVSFLGCCEQFDCTL